MALAVELFEEMRAANTGGRWVVRVLLAQRGVAEMCQGEGGGEGRAVEIAYWVFSIAVAVVVVRSGGDNFRALFVGLPTFGRNRASLRACSLLASPSALTPRSRPSRSISPSQTFFFFLAPPIPTGNNPPIFSFYHHRRHSLLTTRFLSPTPTPPPPTKKQRRDRSNSSSSSGGEAPIPGAAPEPVELSLGALRLRSRHHRERQRQQQQQRGQRRKWQQEGTRGR